MNKTKIVIFGLVAFLLVAVVAGATLCFVFIHVFWPFIVAGLLVIAATIIFALRIIVSLRSPYAKACWLLVIICLPVLGLIIFLIFGINPLIKRQRKNYLSNQKAYFKSESYDLSKKVVKDHHYGWLFAYGFNNMYKPIYKDNDIKVISDSSSVFEESIKLIRSAKEFINVQSFIFKYKGFWTRLFFAELVKKANQGVKVRIMYDWLGAFKRVKTKTFQILQKYGVEVACFNPKGFNVFKGATNYRLHSKFIIVDNKAALYGGSNFADEYLSMAKYENHWNDLNFLIKGPIVNSMNTTFINYWLTFSENSTTRESKQNIRNDAHLLLARHDFKANDTLAQLLVFEPNFNEFALNNALINSFYNAKKSIKIITPYLCPPDTLIEALNWCHGHGIKVEIVTHSKNQKYVGMMNRETTKKLVDMGMSVYEYDGYLHSKLIIIDDEYVLTGSCNIDYRSIYLDFESELIVYDKDFTNGVLKYYESCRKNATIQTSQLLASKLNSTARFVLRFLNIGKSLF